MKKKVLITFLLLSMLPAGSQENFYDSLQKKFNAAVTPRERFDLLHQMAEGLFRGANAKIDTLCLQMLRIAQDEENDSLLAISYNWLGNYFSWTSNYKQALEYFLKGVPLAEKVNDKRRLSSLYIDISIIHSSINDPGEQIKYIRLASDNLPDPSSPVFPFMEIQVKSLFAKYYLANKQSDSALYYARAVEQINLKLKNIFFETMSNSLLGNIYEQQNNYDLAELYHKKSIAVLDSMPQLAAVAFQRNSYSEFLINQNKMDAALIHARHSLVYGKGINSNEIALAAAGYLQNIYDKLGKTDSAYYYSRLKAALKDSVFSREKINQIQSLTFAEKLRARDEELKNMAAEGALQREIQYLFISIAILLLAILFLLLSHSIIVNEAMIKFIGIMVLLIFFEFINLLIHPFLGKITHHSPLLMLLIMVGIAALLVPLHHKIEKWITHQLVEKNKRIRLAAARRTIEKLEKN
jgi:hypothetical protein